MQDPKRTFAGYQLHEPLSTDSVSTLYRATARGRDVGRNAEPPSIALLVSNLLDSDLDRRQAQVFHRKARAAMDVRHPGVAHVLDAGSAEGRVYLATAWRESVTLDEVIGAQWRLTPDEAIELLDLLARGLDAAHEAGLVHGALSTRTIRIDNGETTGRRSAFVTGFGIDALLIGRQGVRRQRVAPVPDDLLYIAPEQLRGGMTEGATDQYGLACALYHCVTGQPPFVRDTPSALFGAHLFARPEATSVLNTTANPALREALAAGMSKRPEDRHTSCTRLLVAAQSGHAAPRLDLSAAAANRPAADRRARMTAGAGAMESTLGAAGARIATLARSGGTRANAYVGRLPAAVVPVLALLAGILLAVLLATVLLVTVLRGDGAAQAGAQDDTTAGAQRGTPAGGAIGAHSAHEWP